MTCRAWLSGLQNAPAHWWLPDPISALAAGL
jgi:hypothetical protein